MTKSEYAEVRDMFTLALQALKEVVEEFAELAYAHGRYEHESQIAEILYEQGSWLTGSEYVGVMDAVALLERLVGRAHERSM